MCAKIVQIRFIAKITRVLVSLSHITTIRSQ